MIRIHHQSRLTLFTPDDSQACPVDLNHLAPHRISFIQHEGSCDEPHVHEDHWPTKRSRPLKQLWTGCTVFQHVVSPNIEEGRNQKPQDVHRLIDPLLISGLWPLPPKQTGDHTGLVEKETPNARDESVGSSAWNLASQEMHKSGPKQVASLAASPLVASTLEPAPQPQLSDSLAFDAWSNQACPALSQCPGAETWVTPGLCRMDSVDQLRSWTSDMLAQMSTTGLAIMV